MLIQNDTAKAEAEIAKILIENAAAVSQYQGGEKKVFGFLMGQCTKTLRGVCTPAVIKQILEQKLSEAKPTAQAERADEKADTTATVTYECTAYSNPDPYKPSRRNDVLQISGDTLIHEFDFSDASDHVGESITIRACVHKIRQMSGFAFIILRTGVI